MKSATWKRMSCRCFAFVELICSPNPAINHVIAVSRSPESSAGGQRGDLAISMRLPRSEPVEGLPRNSSDRSKKIPLYPPFGRPEPLRGAARQGKNRTWLRTLTGCAPGQRGKIQAPSLLDHMASIRRRSLVTFMAGRFSKARRCHRLRPPHSPSWKNG